MALLIVKRFDWFASKVTIHPITFQVLSVLSLFSNVFFGLFPKSICEITLRQVKPCIWCVILSALDCTDDMKLKKTIVLALGGLYKAFILTIYVYVDKGSDHHFITFTKGVNCFQQLLFISGVTTGSY